MHCYSIQFVRVLGAWGTAAFFVRRVLHPGLTGIKGECRADLVCPRGFYFVLFTRAIFVCPREFYSLLGFSCLRARDYLPAHVLLLVDFPCGARESCLSAHVLPYVGFVCYAREPCLSECILPHVGF
jgi:hypothetical protein